jgi:hypothetical protein
VRLPLGLASLLSGLPRRALQLGRGGGPPPNPMQTPLVTLGCDDALSAEDLTQGVSILGATGSAKTSSSGATLARSMLNSGFGGIVLCAKSSEFELWQGYARDTGREADVARFAPDERWRYNLLDFEYTRPSRGGGLALNIAALLLEGMELAGRGKNSGGGDSYWKDALAEQVTSQVDLVSLATGTVRLSDMLLVLQTAAQSREEVHSREWMESSACFAMLLAAGKAARERGTLEDYSITENHWLRTFPELASRTRSIIVSSFTALVSPMLRNPMRELFSTTTNITPQACEQGAIIVLDLPVKDFGAVGTFAQVLWKLSAQKTWEQRDVAKSPVPLFLWADEAPYFVGGTSDLAFTATARSSRVCTVFISQSLPAYYAALGKDHEGKEKADALLANLTTKIWHANADVTTNENASQTIGQTWQMRAGSNTGYSATTSQQGAGTVDTVTSVNASDSRGSSFQEQLTPRVLPVEFTALRQGGFINGFEADAILFKPGRVFRATGTNYIRVTFKQSGGQ